MEVKYRKRGGGCKVVSDPRIQISEVDGYLNEIMRKTHFKEFISVKMIDVHSRPVHGVDDSDSDEEESVGEEVSSVESSVQVPPSSPGVIIGQ